MARPSCGPSKGRSAQWVAAMFALRPEPSVSPPMLRLLRETVRCRADSAHYLSDGAGDCEVNCAAASCARVIPCADRFQGNRLYFFHRGCHPRPGYRLSSVHYSRAYKTLVFSPAAPLGRFFLLLPYRLMFAHSFWAVPDGVPGPQWQPCNNM